MQTCLDEPETRSPGLITGYSNSVISYDEMSIDQKKWLEINECTSLKNLQTGYNLVLIHGIDNVSSCLFKP